MVQCPFCRAQHADPCGTRVYVEVNCEICSETAKRPLVVLPCAHGVCEDCFVQMEGRLVQTPLMAGGGNPPSRSRETLVTLRVF